MSISKYFNRTGLLLITALFAQSQDVATTEVDDTAFLTSAERAIASNQTPLNNIRIFAEKDVLFGATRQEIPLVIKTINKEGNVAILPLPPLANITFSKNPKTREMEMEAMQRLTANSLTEHFKALKRAGVDLRRGRNDSTNYNITLSAGRYTQADPNETTSFLVKPSHSSLLGSPKKQITGTLNVLLKKKEARSAAYKPHPFAVSFTQSAKTSTRVPCIGNKNGIPTIEFINGHGSDITPEKNLFCNDDLNTKPKQKPMIFASLVG